MTDADDPDREALQEELGQIKRAVGLHEEHPHWWQWWLVEGVTVAIIFPLLNVGFEYGYSYPLIGAIVGVFLVHQVVLSRIMKRYDEPTTGVPSWGRWHLVFFAGIAALFVGTQPIYGAVEGLADTPLLLLAVGTVLGVAYMYMGQLLSAYGIRDADCYAFYAGGAWILAVSAALPWIGAVENWEFAALGVAYGSYCVVAYVVLGRI